MVRTAVLSILVMYAADTRAQMIDLWINEGRILVNEVEIPTDQYPDGLDLEGIDLRINLSGQDKLIVNIDGEAYEISQDAIERAADADRAHITVESAGRAGQWRYSIGSDLDWTESFLTGIPDLTEVSDLVQMAGNLGTESIAAGETARHLAQMAQEHVSSLPELRRMAELLNYFTEMHAADVELYGDLRHEWSTEAQVNLLAAQIREMREGDDRDEKIEELRNRLSDIFDMKQENRRREIEQLRTEIKRLEDRVRERSWARQRLIEARLKALLGQGHDF